MIADLTIRNDRTRNPRVLYETKDRADRDIQLGELKAASAVFFRDSLLQCLNVTCIVDDVTAWRYVLKFANLNRRCDLIRVNPKELSVLPNSSMRKLQDLASIH